MSAADLVLLIIFLGFVVGYILLFVAWPDSDDQQESTPVRQAWDEATREVRR